MATSTATTLKSTVHGDRHVRSERIFNATRERVWNAMTQPDLVAQWWGRGNRLEVEKFEPTPGGHWRFVEHSDEGSYGFEGRFGDIVPMERMRQTFEFDLMPTHVSLDEMTLTDLEGSRTLLIVESTFMTSEDRDGMVASGMAEGQEQSYQALDRLLAK